MILIVDCGSSKSPLIVTAVNNFGHSSHCLAMEEFPFIKHPENYLGIIISGSPILLTETDKETYLSIFKVLKHINIPILGICFGHQVLGLLFGSAVYLGEAQRESVNIDIVKNEYLFEGFDTIAFFEEDHTEGITLPSDFTLLASSEKYLVESMKHSIKSIYGVQFHPEVSGENGKKIFRNFLRICTQIS